MVRQYAKPGIFLILLTPSAYVVDVLLFPNPISTTRPMVKWVVAALLFLSLTLPVVRSLLSREIKRHQLKKPETVRRNLSVSG
jgi:hypothetical protein